MTPTHTFPGAWHAVIDFLRCAGVDTVFGLPSDDLSLLTALNSTEPTRPRLVLCRDQRNATFMATGYALQTNSPGVCVVGKGPAVTNTLTGLLEASCSAAPLLLLATGTATRSRGSAAFQELDQVSVLRPLLKWVDRVDHPSRLVPALEKAWRKAVTGTPGPVYLELPEELFDADIERTRPWQLDTEEPEGYRIQRTSPALTTIAAARKPIVLIGGGTRHCRDRRVFERFAERIGAAVFSTASGRGVFDESHEQFVGLSGLYLRPQAKRLWDEADLIVAFGSRLEETATFGWDDNALVVQVNIAPEEFSAEFPGHRVAGDAAHIAHEWTDLLNGHVPDPDWLTKVGAVRRDLFTELRSVLDENADGERIRVVDVLAAIEAVLPEDRILVQENGLQDMWSYIFPFYHCGRSGGSIVPSEQTSLGFGAAASGGVALAAPGRQVVAFVGDGAFNLFRSDLSTFAREQLGVLFVVLCNGGYGWLQSQLDQRGLDGERFRFIDSSRITAEAGDGFDVHQAVVSNNVELEPELRKAFENSSAGRVSVVYVPVDLSDSPAGISEIDGDFPVISEDSESAFVQRTED